VVTLIAGLLLPGGAYAADQEPVDTQSVNPAVAAFDVVIVRPLGLAVLAIGAVLFPPVALVTSPGGKHSLREGLDFFVVGPAENVFKRPLGEF
jgi:hypothetical protein